MLADVGKPARSGFMTGPNIQAVGVDAPTAKFSFLQAE